MTDVKGIVLAGGKSRRYGSPKAFEKMDGIYFYEKSIAVLEKICDDLVMITSENLIDQFTSTYRVTVDDRTFQEDGPLAGIYTGMNHFEAEWFAVLPVDVPLMDASIFQRLIAEVSDEIQAVIPIVDKKKQPLIALYHHSVRSIIVDQLTKGEKSLHALLDRIETKEVHVDDSTPFLNVNTPSDYPL